VRGENAVTLLLYTSKGKGNKRYRRMRSADDMRTRNGRRNDKTTRGEIIHLYVTDNRDDRNRTAGIEESSKGGIRNQKRELKKATGRRRGGGRGVHNNS